MRYLSSALLASALALAAGCTGRRVSTDFQPSPQARVTPTPNPVFVALRLFETRGGVKWEGIPRAVLAEEMSFSEANARIGGDIAAYDLWPEETRVWLIKSFRGAGG